MLEEVINICHCYKEFKPGMPLPVSGDLRNMICSKCNRRIVIDYSSVEVGHA